MPHQSRPDRPVLLLDSASLYYRAFFALPESMTSPDGRPHNAVRGFLSTLTRLIEAHSPAQILPCWDEDWRPAWRVDLIPSYKAHRVAEPIDGAAVGANSGGAASGEAEPESLGAQAVAIAELLTAAGIGPVGKEGYEADDVIASLARQTAGDVIAVSGDRDLVQVVDDTTRLLLTVNGGMDKWPLLGPAEVMDRFGVRPEQYVALAVLRGDPSDGLPGVKGIGAKTAVSLVTAFEDLDGIVTAARAHPVQKPLTARLAALVDESADLIDRARTVATAVTDLSLDTDRPARDDGRLSELAAEWGVERQVAALTKAMRQTAEE